MPTENKPSRNEDEYFAKQDAELVKSQRAKLDAERASAERKSHHMKCPKCGGDLQEIEFHHVKVDRCPDCGGLWFDKGETEMFNRVGETRIGEFVRSIFGGLPSK